MMISKKCGVKMEISKRLANFVFESEYGDISREAINAAKKDILDFVGCALIGVKTPIDKIVKEYLKDLGGVSQSTVIGSIPKTSCPNAAFANGALGHSLDYDDSLSYDVKLNGSPSTVFVGHIASPVLPAALAMGESVKADGKSLLASYIIGVEVACRVAAGVQPILSNRGFHSTPTIGIFGAAAAACKLLQLDEEKIAYALGIAASESSGLSESFGSMTKPIQVGRAVEGGVVAALLAKNGCTSAKNIFEGSLGGFCKAVADNNYLDGMVENLPPKSWAISKVAWKRYPTCAETHTSIDAVTSIAKNNSIKVDNVESIELGVSPESLQRNLLQIDRLPTTMFEGKFSIQFCLAVGLLFGTVSPEQVTDEKVKDPRVVQLMNKVKSLYAYRGFYPSVERFTPDTKEGVPRGAVVVIVRMKDGSEYRKEALSPERLTEEELIEKYQNNAKAVLKNNIVEKSKNLILDLENVTDTNDLMKLLHAA